MARDTSILPDGGASYEKIKNALGEEQADAWFDKTVVAYGVSPTAIPAAPQPVTVSTVPTPTAMQAATGAGEFAPKPTIVDIVSEEQKSLEAATKRLTDVGVPTREQVKSQVQMELTAQGYSPFGSGAADYNKRLVDEMNKRDFAEKKAQEQVASARRPLVTGFDRGAPIVGESTLAKEPSMVAGMGAGEALVSAFRPQVTESPEEAAARSTAERQQKQVDKMIADLATGSNVSVDEASKKFYGSLQEDFLADAKSQLPLYDVDQQKAEAKKNYLAYLKQNLPDEYNRELRRPTEEAAFNISGAQSGGVATGKSMLGNAGEIALSFLSSDKYDPETYKEMKKNLGITPNTEAVVESLPMTTLRDLGGVLRFAVNPVMDVVMYDVDPTTGKEINPDEWGFVPRERTGGKEERAFGKSYIAPKDSGISGKVKEIAVEIATGRTLGDDLASQQAVADEDEMAYRGIGMLAELALPVNPLEFAKVIPGGKAVASAIKETVPVANNWWQVESKLIKPLQKAGAEGKILGDEIKKSSSLKKWFIDSNSMAAQQATAVTDDLITLRRIAEGEQIEGSAGINKMFRDLNVVDEQKFAKNLLNKLATSPENTITKNAAQIAQKIPASEIGTEAARLQIANAAKQGLSQTTLGQWTFATPRIVTTTKWAEKNLDNVYDTANNTYRGLINVTTDTSGARSIVAKTDFANVSPLLETYAAISRPITGTAESSKINEILGSIKAGDKLTAEQYALLQRIVDDGSVLITAKAVGPGKLGEGAPIALTRTGRAYESALVPKEMQTALQTGKQFISNVIPSAKLEGEVIPLAVQQLKNDYIGYARNADSQYAATISGLAKQKLSPEQIYGQLVARSISSDPTYAKYGAFASDVNKLQTIENAEEQAKRILGLHYGEASTISGLNNTPRGRAIINEIDAIIKESNISLANPDTFVREVTSIASRIEQKIPELANNKAKDIKDVILALVNEDSKNRALSSFYKAKAEELASTTYSASLKKVGLSAAEQSRISSYDNAINNLEEAFRQESRRVDDQLDQIKLLPRSKLIIPAPGTQEAVKKELLTSYRQYRIDKEKAVEGIAKERDAYLASLNKPIDKIITSQKPYIDALTTGLQKSLANEDISGVLQQSLKDAGYADDQIVAVLEKYGDQFVSDVNNFHMDVLRATGGLPIAPSEAMTRLNLGLTKIGDNINLMPSNLSAEVKKIQSIMTKAERRDVNNFALTVSEIERQQPGLTGKLINDIVMPATRATYGAMVEGMLAGRSMPNYTYLSENVITAPLIAAVTNPSYLDEVLLNVPGIGAKSLAGATGGIGEFGKYHGYSYNIFDAARNAPDAVAFTTAAGKKVTNTELLDMWRKANIGSSNAAYVVGPDVTKELKALAEREFSGAGAYIKKFVRDFAPSTTMSIPSISAANADMAFRMSLFKEALRRGATESQATAIARDTLLDYGTLNRIVPEQFGAVKRGVLFLSFQAAMSTALVNAMFKGETAENILRLARYHKDLAQFWGSGAYADQPQLEAMWLGNVGEVGGKPTQMSYLRDPVMGQLFWSTGLADSAANFFNAPTDSALNIVESTGFNPALQLLLDLKDARANKSIPPRQIALLKATGMWDTAVKQLNIRERKPEEMRIGDPTFDGRQYVMNSEADAKKYVAFMYGLTAVGWNRMLNDWTNAAVASGIVPEGAYMARYTPGNNQFEGVQSEGKLLNGALYFIVRGRAQRVPTAIEEQDRQIQTEMRRLKDIQ